MIMRFNLQLTLAVVFVIDLLSGVHGHLLSQILGDSLDSQRSGAKLRRYYDGIDNFLEESVTGDDVAIIMEVIENWIERESSRGKLNKNDSMRLSALIQLYNLVQIEGPGRCTPSTGRILQDNDLSLKGAINKLMPGDVPQRKLERFVNYYATKFINDCDYEVLLRDADPKHLRYIAKIVGELVGARAKDEMKFQTRAMNPLKFVEEQPLMASNFAKNLKGIRPERDSFIIANWLKRLSQENYDALTLYLKKVKSKPDDEPHVDSRNLYKLYRTYLVKPCTNFVGKVESSFENQWALAQFKKLHKSKNTEPFYRNLTYYYGCKLVLNYEEKLFKGLKAIVEAS